MTETYHQRKARNRLDMRKRRKEAAQIVGYDTITQLVNNILLGNVIVKHKQGRRNKYVL